MSIVGEIRKGSSKLKSPRLKIKLLLPNFEREAALEVAQVFDKIS